MIGDVKLTKTTLCLVKSGDKVPKDGYYVYFRHSNVNEFDDCFVTDKARSGLYLSKGSITPTLGSCTHDVIWRLDSS